jgi:hypothetical protein
MRLGMPQSPCGEEINSHPLSGFQLTIIQPVALRYTTELTWLQTQVLYWWNLYECDHMDEIPSLKF